MDRQIGDLAYLDHSLLAQNTNVSDVNLGHDKVSQSLGTPGNWTHANPWAAAHPNNHTIAPFVNSDPSQLTGSTFTAGVACNDDLVLPNAPHLDAWGPAVATAHPNNDAFTPSVDPNFLQLTESTFAAGATYDGGQTFSTAPDPYSRGRATATDHWDHHDAAPFTNSNPPHFTGSAFAATAPYNDNIALPTAPSPYAMSPAVPTGPTHPHLGASIQYPDLSFPMTDPFTTANNSNGYHGPLPATSFTTQWGASLDSPNMVHATDNAFPFPAEIGEAPQPRPTCTTCNRSFGRQGDLVRHAKKHLAGPKAFPCAVAGCPYANDRKDKLRDHHRRRHPGVAVSFTQS